MAYDPKDPADVAIVQGLIDTALEEARETHEAEIVGLKNKNTDLLGKLRKARAGGDDTSAAEIDRLENELAGVQSDLSKAKLDLSRVNRDLATRTTELGTANTALEAERTFSRDTLVDSQLTTALVGANVKPEFLEDVTASLSRNVTVREVEGKRQAFVGDKSLGDFVKEWSQGDKGKHYIGAPNNGGGGSGGSGTPSGGDKKIYQMNGAERNAFYHADPAAFEAAVKRGEDKAPPTT